MLDSAPEGANQMRSRSMRRSLILAVGISVGLCLGASSVAWAEAGAAEARALYLDLMKRSLLDLIYENDFRLRNARSEGIDWPSRAMTMIGQKRLDNLQQVSEDVIARGVPGISSRPVLGAAVRRC